MANAECVGRAIAALAELPRQREITEATVGVYALALDDLADAELDRAVKRALRECRFFPSPAELREFAGANTALSIDLDGILNRIVGLRSYLPTTGTQPPSTDSVRRVLGDAIGDAYSQVGHDGLFSPNETTRTIARREFLATLGAAVKREGPSALAPPEGLPAIPTPDGPVIYGARPAVARGPQPILQLLPKSLP